MKTANRLSDGGLGRVACVVAAILGSWAGLPSSAYGHATEKVLFTFRNDSGGKYPSALISDRHGNLYGVAQAGGNLTNCGGFGCGLAFELSPTAEGSWKQTVLHVFNGGIDGIFPVGGLIFDSAGNLYGTTSSGGRGNAGVVFELSPTSSGFWSETLLYTFKGLSDGGKPYASLVFDSAGNLYGTTLIDGDFTCKVIRQGCGTVFKLSPASDGRWQESVIHAFNGAQGAAPGSIVFDSSGNLYGTTEIGGDASLCDQGCGVVFELSPGPNGAWEYAVLRAFSGGRDGASPMGVVLDALGDLYGATSLGGNLNCFGDGCGVVFKLSASAPGHWTETVLHAFSGGMDGGFPGAGVVLDPSGNLYGTTFYGGTGFDLCLNGCGVVFELSLGVDGDWKETELHAFRDGADGAGPYTNLILDSAGNVYGSASPTMLKSAGEVFQITP